MRSHDNVTASRRGPSISSASTSSSAGALGRLGSAMVDPPITFTH